MSAPYPSPVVTKALEWGERATRAVLTRLAYAQHTTVERTAVIDDGACLAALLVGGRYVVWPEVPRARRFGCWRTIDADALAWRLALRADGAQTPIGRYDALGEVLKALIRELLCDRFLPMRHRQPSPADGSVRA